MSIIKRVGENTNSPVTPHTFVLTDTTKLQLASLDGFAEQLGYIRNPSLKNVYVKASCGIHGDYNSDKNYISLMTMQKYHNTSFMKHVGLFTPNHFSEESERLGFRVEDMSDAIASKLVVKTKLQVTKKGDIIVQDHQIKFA